MLENAPRIAKQLAANIELNDGQKNKAREIMEKERIIQICPDGDCTIINNGGGWGKHY